MKKLFYLFLVLIFVFGIIFSNAKAVTQSAASGFNNFSTSFDIGNFMATSYSRWIWNENDQRCKETKTKTDGDYGTESECKADHTKPAYTITDNFVSNWNTWSADSFETEETTNVQIPKVEISDPAKWNFNVNDWSAVDTPSITPQTLTPSVTDNNFTFSLEGSEPVATPKKIITNPITSVINGLNLVPTILPTKVEPTISTTTNIFTNLLQGLGFIKPSSVANNPAKIEILGGGDHGESEATNNNGFIWYNKEYAFKVDHLVSETGKGGGDTIDTKYNYNSKLPISIEVKIRQKIESRGEDVGVLYSYMNNKDERVFDNFELKVIVPAYEDSPNEYYNRSFVTFLDIPNDIKIENDKGTLEFFVVIRPTYYAHYKTSDNNYRVWREAEKSIITFDFEDDSFGINYLKSYCKFSFAEPIPKSNFLDNKDPYYTNFKLSINMECDTSFMRNKNKTLPKDIWVSYTMNCPRHFDSDWKSQSGNYNSEFLNNSKEFIGKLPININEPKFSTNLILEDTTLIDILRKKYYSIKVNPNDFKIPFAFDLSKRCDLTAYIYSNGEEIAQLKDYFYLNQCNVNIINAHPDWTYCTENKYGNPAPIDVKVIFANCAHDHSEPLQSISFAIYPNPDQKIKKIYDSDYQDPLGISTNNWQIDDKLGQTIYTNINGGYWFDRYFEETQITKHAAKGPSNLSFNLADYFVDESVVRKIPSQHWAQTDQFKVFYGYNEECDNIIQPMPTWPDNPQPKLPPDTSTTTTTKGDENQPQPGILNAIINFFSGWFK